MKMKPNELIQWIGAVFIIGGHSLNAVGPKVYPYNIFVFLIGTIMFLIWTFRVKNRPQLVVNFVALCIGITGAINALT